MVRSLRDALEQVGFVVSKPKRIPTDGGDEVLIRAHKPSGPTIHVRANGSLLYRFDDYQGMQCKDDIDKMLPLLQDIYGIDLSKERVLWQNPDKISRSSRPINPTEEEQQDG